MVQSVDSGTVKRSVVVMNSAAGSVRFRKIAVPPSLALASSCFVLAVPGMAYADRSRLDPRRGHDQSGQVSSR